MGAVSPTGNCVFLRVFRRLGLGRCRAFLEQGLGLDHRFFGFCAFRQHVFAARLAFGLVLGAGDVDRHRHADFGMQNDDCRDQADRLDRLVERNLGAIHREAARLITSAISRGDTDP